MATNHKNSYTDLFHEATEELSLNTFSTSVSMNIPDYYNNFEDARAKKQLSHYFDYSPNEGPAVPPSINTVTRKDIKRFKTRKQERKRIKHKWMFEK